MTNYQLIEAMKPGETRHIVGKNARTMVVTTSKVGIDKKRKHATYNDETGFYVWRVK